MAPRKGNGRQAVRNKNGGFPGWGYAIIGILVGAVLMLIVMRHSLLPMTPKGPQPNADATAEHASEPGLEPAASDTAPKKPQYDFYSVLSEKEVRIPDAQISAQARAEQQQKQQAAQQQAAQQQATQQQVAQQQAQSQQVATVPKAPPRAPVTQTVTAAPAAALPAPAAAGAGGYLLQIGAFPSAGDAESLKARMAMQGFVANVQSVNVNGQNYHRVRLGPFHSATELESTKQRLSAAGINAIALKEGK